jgi:hypothetical protein
MKNKIILLCFLGITVVFVIHAIHLTVIAEDAFISFSFAHKLASGDGLVWNIGEPPVEGYTNFLWVIICSCAILTGANLILFTQITGIVASIITLIYVYVFCNKLLEFGSYTSLLPCLLLALAGPFATWAVSGMETNLFALFVTAICYHGISYWKYFKKASLILSFSFCFLATLTRPEGFGIFIILLALHLTRVLIQKDSKEISGTMILAVIVYIIPFLIYFAWRISYYGYLLPLTFYAKTGGTVFQWFRGFAYFSYFSFHFLLPFVPLLLLLFWENLFHLKKIDLSSIKKIIKDNQNRRFGLLVCSTICLTYSVFIIIVGGDYMAMYRFFVPVLPFIYILAAAGFHHLLKIPGITRKKDFLVLALIFISLAATFLQSTPLERYLFAKPFITHGQYQGVKTERWHTNRLSLIGKFFNNYKSDENESLATDAIGAISYYSNLKIYGLHGIVDPVIATMETADLGKGFPGHEKSDLLYVLSNKPTYFMYTRDLTKDPGKYPEYSDEINKFLVDNYTLVYKWFEDEKNSESGYFNFLQRKNLQK